MIMGAVESMSAARNLRVDAQSGDAQDASSGVQKQLKYTIIDVCHCNVDRGKGWETRRTMRGWQAKVPQTLNALALVV